MFENKYNDSNTITNASLWIKTVANDIIQQLKEQNKILKSIDNHLDKLVRKPIK